MLMRCEHVINKLTELTYNNTLTYIYIDVKSKVIIDSFITEIVIFTVSFLCNIQLRINIYS